MLPLYLTAPVVFRIVSKGGYVGGSAAKLKISGQTKMKSVNRWLFQSWT